ncbi:MAG: hypothetical protein WD077_04740 [Bacteroidia bacterium]
MKPYFPLTILLMSLLWSCSGESCQTLQQSSIQLEFYRKDAGSGFLSAVNLRDEFDSIIINDGRGSIPTNENFVSVDRLSEDGISNFFFFKDGISTLVSFQADAEELMDKGPGKCGEYYKFSNMNISHSGFEDIELKNTNAYNNDFTAIVIID